MNKLFQRYNELASLAGIDSRGSKESLEWFRTRVRKDRRITNFDKISEGLERADLEIGEMVTYIYKPLGEKTLKYYDTQPLVVLLDFYEDGWLGINVHYLAPVFRSKLFEEARYSKKRMMALAFDLEKNPISRPAFKRYKAKQLQTRPFSIPKEEWEIAIQLPYEDFRKKNIKQVWRDSRRKIK